MATGICKLVGRHGQFVDAHIVPKAFYGEAGKVKAISSLPSDRPKRMPIGQYDPRLVIDETEKRFAAWDDYGIRFMRQLVGTWTPLAESKGSPGFAVTAFDYALLRLFFLSVLWRATASGLVAPKADLRGKASRLKRLVARSDPGRPDQFAVRLIRYPDANTGVILPMAKEVDSAVCAFSYFGGYEILWSMKRPTIMTSLYLRPDQPWCVPSRPWSGSVSKRMLLNAVATHPNAFR